MLQPKIPSACCGQLDCLHSSDNKRNTNEIFWDLDWFEDHD